MRIVTSLAFVLAATTLPASAQIVDHSTASAHGIQATQIAPAGPVRSTYRGRARWQGHAHRHNQSRRHSHSTGASASRGCLTGETRQVLAGLEARFGAMRVISTCRPGAVIAGSGRPSQHRYGKAVDFIPTPGQRGPIMAWLRANAGGAVITYASGHIHFDTGGYRNYAVSAKARRAYARGR